MPSLDKSLLDKAKYRAESNVSYFLKYTCKAPVKFVVKYGEVSYETELTEFSRKETSYYGVQFVVKCDPVKCAEYSHSNFVSFPDAVYLALMHEAFHVLGKHYDYEEKDEKLWHLACDLEVNELLDLKYPFKRPADYGFPGFLKADLYYELLKNYYDKSDTDDTAEYSEDGYSSVYYDRAKYYADLPDFSEAYDDIKSDSEVSFYDVAVATKKAKESVKSVLYPVRGMEELVRYVTNYADKPSVKPYDKEYDWLKFNNRRTPLKGSGQFLVLRPGPVKKEGGYDKDHGKKSVVFIDTSISTKPYSNQLTAVAKELQAKCGVTVVEYSTVVKRVYEPYDEILAFDSGGGTSIKHAVEIYESQYSDEIEHLFVVSDGEDDYSEVLEKYKAKVFVVDKYEVYLLKSS